MSKLYHWFWHDLLRLKESISWIIVHSIRAHLFWWDAVGALTVSTIWVLIMHFIAMR
jgi:hypothetical protein